MKKHIVVFSLLCCTLPAMSQYDSTMKTFVDSVCKCLTRIDLSGVKTSSEAKAVLGKCFLSGNMDLLMKLAEEKGVDISSSQAMEKIGQDVGVELFKQGCQPFIQLSIRMAKEDAVKEADDVEVDDLTGTLTSIETKEFTKFIVTETSGKRHTLYWLHHFKNSEKFIDQPSKYIGKKMKIYWQEMEVFVPSAKGYFKIKEIKAIEVL